MSLDSPLRISQSLLAATGTRMFVYHEDRIPSGSPALVVSNHRSFMDAPVLMAGVGQPIRFACHHYMAQVPVLRDVVNQCGAFPLEAPAHRQQAFFQQATGLLQTRQMVGLFPEGAQPMVRSTKPEGMGQFHRGFAHLALRAKVQDLVVLPVAIASCEEIIVPWVPLKLLSSFDPTEPAFQQEGWHPMVIYKRVNVLIGRPFWITAAQRESYQGKKAKIVVDDLLGHTHREIADLLYQGCY
ncbi:lysophospholipid acyltransferase family protein [Microcoleus sp. FACHB-68]|uniref:lysophospholipid acyltransferase family protein n=1 Tax=Microcoleus sp. FACHB-68 TaxID=2692826 RepID=UPI001689B70A|nr:lysophospholipid acyltransferase family protein [Microcoleus sp. FACHB-68]MBD1940331.1 1-acyl-sn-glycerol-3-phosphate acyltransferase [Microcoleus sp. FACHB-68]